MKDDQASSTAFTVLQGVLLVAAQDQYGAVVADEVVQTGRRILAASTEGRRRLRQLGQPWSRWAGSALERLLMPGITLHYVLRKRFIEDTVRDALSEGVLQVIVLGAGFDTLAWRLHQEHPAATFIELDHPATSRLKSEALIEPAETPSNLHLQAVDLTRHELAEALIEQRDFRRDVPTIFICEGVLMYLAAANVCELFRSIADLCGPGTKLVFTAVEPVGSPNNNRGILLRPYLWWKNEPLKWTIHRHNIGEFLAKQQYDLLDIATHETFRARYLPADFRGRLHTSEYIAVAKASI